MLTLSKNAETVLKRRYLMKNAAGETVETPEALFRRVANAVAASEKDFGLPEKEIESLSDSYYTLMTSLVFLPNSPTLMNAGRPLGQLSACFVLPVEDSMEKIFESVKNAALIHKSGGGTGFSFSRLRPAGSTVNSTGGVASGPVSFMKVFNAATEAVKQGGTRRGANMGILRVDHPDILSFISCKEDSREINNFNISVGLTEAFMEAAEKGENYDLFDPSTKQKAGSLNAGEVFGKIVKGAWQNGEPGIVFLDRINRDNPVPSQGEIESTNPCGEQPLLPYESCNLGSINLGKLVKNTEQGPEIDFERLGDTVELAVRFLDDVIEGNAYPLPEIRETTLKTRKIGLGVMGFADMLFQLGVSYASEEGVKTAEQVMSFINDRARSASVALGKERGSFPLFKESVFAGLYPALRNATATTIAPTGTISIIAGASSGVEPLFALSFVRNVMDNDELPEVDPCFEKIAREQGFYSPALMRRIAKAGTLAHEAGVPEAVRKVFVTAHDVSPEYHIRMQAAFQKYTDNAVSKTVNFKHEASEAEVGEVFTLAYRLGCKGVTIYRDGSRSEQVLYVGDKKQPAPTPGVIVPRPRPSITRGITEKVVIGCGNLYVTVNYDDQGICEVFANLGRAGGCPSQSEATSRLVSMALRSGMDVHTVIEQLKGIRCHSTLRQKATNKNIAVLSCPDAIGRVLEKVVKLREEELATHVHSSLLPSNAPVPPMKAQAAKVPEAPENDLANAQSAPDPAAPDQSAPIDPGADMLSLCPECGGPLTHESGCVICPACGYSKCG